MTTDTEPVFRYRGRCQYEPTWREMQAFTRDRTEETADEIWFLEHPPVYTLGLNGSRDHVLAPGDIPVVDIDRGGQVTYHGPGQLVFYPLVNLRHRRMGIRNLVASLENAVIDTVAKYGIEAAGRRDAPGVYVDGRKLASIGLKVSRGCTYHGVAFNVNMDLEPFQRINPCGFEGLEVTQLSELGGPGSPEQVAADLEPALLDHLGYRRSSAA